ncbi:MAG: phosphatase PAP2 family protein [Deltaproteobacteria bacterium]|nr:phosphatase PAP2 family protein [Deltaproteobacteria bacterium]
MTATAPLPRPRWDFWVRYALLAALLGVIVGQWLMLLVGLVVPDGFGHLHSILFCALYVPLAVIPATLWLVRRRWRRVPSFRERPRGSDLRWTLLGLGAFVAWSQSYLAVAWFVEGRALHYFPAALEDALPFVPAATLVYLTVYWFAPLPLFLLRDPVPWRRVVAAYLLTLGPTLVAFAAFPVAMERPVVDPGIDLFHWALSVVHRADPPYNCFPSSHCAMAMLGGLLLFDVDRRLGRLGVLYAGLIGLSTLLTRQHYLVDVLAGFALATAAWWALLSRHRQRNPPGPTTGVDGRFPAGQAPLDG